MLLPRRQRLILFFQTLNDAPAATTMEDAYDLLCDCLNQIEDAHSGVDYNPDHFQDDGRLYPPLADARRQVPGRPDLLRYRSRGHNTYVSADGAILIQTTDKPPQEILRKAGASGQNVEL